MTSITYQIDVDESCCRQHALTSVRFKCRNFAAQELPSTRCIDENRVLQCQKSEMFWRRFAFGFESPTLASPHLHFAYPVRRQLRYRRPQPQSLTPEDFALATDFLSAPSRADPGRLRVEFAALRKLPTLPWRAPMTSTVRCLRRSCAWPFVFTEGVDGLPVPGKGECECWLHLRCPDFPPRVSGVRNHPQNAPALSSAKLSQLLLTFVASCVRFAHCLLDAFDRCFLPVIRS